MADKIQLWHTPSGRLHQMRRCSGGASPRNTKPVKLTDEQLLAVEVGTLCRCAFHSFELARKRHEEATT